MIGRVLKAACLSIVAALAFVGIAQADPYAVVITDKTQKEPEIIIEETASISFDSSSEEDQYVTKTDFSDAEVMLESSTILKGDPTLLKGDPTLISSSQGSSVSLSIQATTDQVAASAWTTTSKNYTSIAEAEQAAKERLRKDARAFKSKIYTTDYGLGVKIEGTVNSKPNTAVILRELIAQLVKSAFLADGTEGKNTIPDLFYVNSAKYTYGTITMFTPSELEDGTGIWTCSLSSVTPTYINPTGTACSNDDARNFSTQFESKVDAIISEAQDYASARSTTGTPSEIDLIHYVHDYLVAHNYYDHENTEWKVGDYDDPWTAYSAVISGRTVCKGYALAAQYILNKMGIECVYVVQNLYYDANGNVTNDPDLSVGFYGGHAWNKVKADGKWYNLDVTWDDEAGSSSAHKYFLKSDSYWINRAGGPDAPKYHTKWTDLGGAATNTSRDNYSYAAFVTTPIDLEPLTDPGVIIDVFTDPENVFYDGSYKRPVKITDGLNRWHRLTEGSDFTITYSPSRDAGIVNVNIVGKGMYSGNKSYSFEIKPITLTKVNLSDKTYTGKPHKISTLTYNGKTLTEGQEYIATYSNNVNAGIATVKFNFIGNYTGTATSQLKINKAANTMTVKANAKTIRRSVVKTRKYTLSKVLSVKNARGTVTYSKAGGSKYLSVNSKTGKITVAKKAPVGTLSIKVKVKAAGNSNYQAATKTVTAKIKVKK